jgi:hypothetical protein
VIGQRRAVGVRRHRNSFCATGSTEGSGLPLTSFTRRHTTSTFCACWNVRTGWFVVVAAQLAMATAAPAAPALAISVRPAIRILCIVRCPSASSAGPA